MEKHYVLTSETKVNIFGIKLFRIKSTKKTKWAEDGELGGWVDTENTPNGNARVSGDAWVSGDAQVYGDAQVSGNARVSGDAWVSGNARVSGNAQVSGDAWVSGNARVYGNARVSGNAQVYGNARVSGNAQVYGDGKIESNNDFCTFQNFGSENRCTTFFKCADGLTKVVCGCFFGTLEQFIKQVEVVKIKFNL
jgi:cytoskeletal protein CcmA (bactofilin family)